MNRSTDIAVIIPVYNGEAFLARAIESVLQQTRSAEQVIVVDDGSTDGTAEVCAAYGEKIEYIRQPNAGVSAARNRGVESAGTEWVAFLDADDWYYPQRLEKHAQVIEAHPDIGFLTGDFDYIDNQGAHLGRSMPARDLGRTLLDECGEAGYAIMQSDRFGDFVQDHFGDTHTLTLRKSTFLSLGGYSTKYQVCEDVHLLTRLCAVSQTAGVVCEPLAAYVIHPGSATRRDPLRAQIQTVAAMEAVAAELKSVPGPLRAGIGAGIRRARLDMAYALLRSNRYLPAVKTVAMSFLRHPRVATLRDLVSVARGQAG